MKIDFLWLPEEPASCTYHAAAELRKLGMLGQAIPSTPDNADATIKHCQQTDADFILFFSGHIFLPWLFDTEAKRRAWRSVRVPLVCWATEQAIGSPFPLYKKWAEERSDCFTHFLAASARDLPFYSSHSPCCWCPMWASGEVFKPNVSWQDRVKRVCFIGLTKECFPGVFDQRNKLLARLKSEGLVDHLHIPRHLSTAGGVAAVYAAYAATIQLPTTGYAYGIRAFEATAAGALLIYCRGPMASVEPDLFPNGVSSLHYDPFQPEELLDLLHYLDWDIAEGIAQEGHLRFKQYFSVEPTIRRISQWLKTGKSIQEQLGFSLKT